MQKEKVIISCWRMKTMNEKETDRQTDSQRIKKTRSRIDRDKNVSKRKCLGEGRRI